ncbi:YxeA family protein [Bacillus mesophilum]|uniref:YxeA family protein n=1 Tax=Bacillus mesophilum TaxID=1071718 RepID=A0A7V7RPE5_9BACI|nr:YxeA family protein [Bacillus mesophilum]KAB2335144.1 YxeA family protein [Bacillus mesophilum]
MKALKITISGLAVMFILVLSMTLLVKNELADMLNPFISQKDVYVRIDSPGTKVNESTFEYTLEGIKEDGKRTNVTFTASKQLREGAYLKLETKRTYVKSWEEVQMSEMPAGVQEKFLS